MGEVPGRGLWRADIIGERWEVYNYVTTVSFAIEGIYR